MTILIRLAAGTTGRIIGAALGYSIARILRVKTAADVDAREPRERRPDAFHADGTGEPFIPRPLLPTFFAAGEAVRCSGPSAEKSPTPAVPPTPAGVGQPNLTAADLAIAGPLAKVPAADASNPHHSDPLGG